MRNAFISGLNRILEASSSCSDACKQSQPRPPRHRERLEARGVKPPAKPGGSSLALLSLGPTCFRRSASLANASCLQASLANLASLRA